MGRRIITLIAIIALAIASIKFALDYRITYSTICFILLIIIMYEYTLELRNKIIKNTNENNYEELTITEYKKATTRKKWVIIVLQFSIPILVFGSIQINEDTKNKGYNQAMYENMKTSLDGMEEYGVTYTTLLRDPLLRQSFKYGGYSEAITLAYGMIATSENISQTMAGTYDVKQYLNYIAVKNQGGETDYEVTSEDIKIAIERIENNNNKIEKIFNKLNFEDSVFGESKNKIGELLKYLKELNYDLRDTNNEMIEILQSGNPDSKHFVEVMTKTVSNFEKKDEHRTELMNNAFDQITFDFISRTIFLVFSAFMHIGVLLKLIKILFYKILTVRIKQDRAGYYE